MSEKLSKLYLEALEAARYIAALESNNTALRELAAVVRDRVLTEIREWGGTGRLYHDIDKIMQRGLHPAGGHEMKRLVIESDSPAVLDETLKSLGAVVAFVEQDGYGDYRRVHGGWLVRYFGNAELLKFALSSQSYGTFIREYEPTP